MDELAEIKEKVKKLLRRGETYKAAKSLNEKKETLSKEDQKSAFRLYIDAENLNRDYINGIIKKEKYEDERIAINQRILRCLGVLKLNAQKKIQIKSSELPSVEPINLTGPSNKHQGFLITLNQKQYWLAFSTHYVEERLYVNQKLYTKKRNLLSYNISYDFDLGENEPKHKFELRVKFSRRWGTIKSVELVYEDKFILYKSK